MTREERKKLIEQIRELPYILEQMLKNLADRQLDTPYRKDGWTIRQVVHHLADSHMNGYIRMKYIMTENHPDLKPYNQDKWAELYDSTRLPVEMSLKILHGLHCRMADFLEHLNDDDWRRSGYHPDHGNWTLEDILTAYSAHGVKHLGHITGLLKSQDWI